MGFCAQTSEVSSVLILDQTCPPPQLTEQAHLWFLGAPGRQQGKVGRGKTAVGSGANPYILIIYRTWQAT